MLCNNSYSNKIIIIPPDCLCNKEIKIPSKRIGESVTYIFSLQRRLSKDDTIANVKGSSPNDSSIKIQIISYEGKTFTASISGGTLATKAAIHFVVYTDLGEEKTFTVSLSIMLDATTNETNCHFVPLPGPQDIQGEVVTLKIGKISIRAPGSSVIIENVRTPNDAILNIIISQDDKGEQDFVFLIGDTDPASTDGIITPAFYVNNRSSNFFYLQKDGAEWNIVLPRGKQGSTGIDKTTYLKGKNISFIGDGLTTFAEHVVEGNPSFYPQYLITNVNQTWWMQLIKKTGATLLTNDAYSGSYLSNHGKGSLQTRFKVIDPKTDICLVLMGANDLINNIALGEFKMPASFSPTNNNFNTSTILGGLCNAIVNLQKNYPKTKFIWITPLKQFNSLGDSNPRTMPGRQVRYAKSNYKEKTDPKYQYYTLIDQSRWQGKLVKRLQIFTLTKPNVNVADITVSLIREPNSPNMQVRRSKNFRIMTGVNYYNLGWYVAPDEYIAVHSNSKGQFPGTWSYSTTATDGSYYYFDPSTNKWAKADGDLNIGIDDAPPGTTTNTLAEKMIEVFQYYGVDYIDSRFLGINSMNQNLYLADGTHPLPAGATLFANFLNNRLYGIF
ncbi:MAG: hypothetical protein ACRCVY_05930 [Commensalibacter sp.]